MNKKNDKRSAVSEESFRDENLSACAVAIASASISRKIRPGSVGLQYTSIGCTAPSHCFMSKQRAWPPSSIWLPLEGQAEAEKKKSWVNPGNQPSFERLCLWKVSKRENFKSFSPNLKRKTEDCQPGKRRKKMTVKDLRRIQPNLTQSPASIFSLVSKDP